MKNFILKNENAIYFECKFSCDNVIFINLEKDKYFITDARYTTEAKEYAKKCEVIESSNLIETAKEILKKNKVKKIVFDPNDFSFASYTKLTENLKTQFIQKENFSKLKRIIKSDKEITLLKKAAVAGREGFKELAKYIRKNGFNQTEQFLYFKAFEKMSQTGKLNISFEPIVAINENAAKPHALPTSKKLKLHDLLLVDAGIKYKRYCSDRTCTSHVDFENFNFKREQKFKNPKHQKVYDIVLKAQLNAITNAKSGMKASEIDKLTRDVIEKAGFGKYFIHSTGHGVGLDIHEFPNINSKSDVIIEDNMVFTIEPGIYLPNEFGVRIEDTVVMQNGKAVIL
ncbi:aminopeptidase P family protein [Aliarcobacter butzleri]|uniref:aminopeptidase P family protein n=1 Tax=Aliarcobacter butzleri TaxID=28197 RepID=UPI0021B49FE1|nr:aminopeptidase P family protein [Aliarcobacter butzleri]MCT7549222.1 aminopeptidase P family protein [Aliarcobacter butzleri]MCT7558694.1 aminopeptidase P family protein [Aliarcobacter butzleri]MCT7563948.1 aminopeptidase P family protein [Aliarcobacter butzleri]MCT7612315.1 aminopeptidase P family protein [Aliarcobacter butzleri]MCT7641477.1 aminopeptidase P family protein [Aliarcobacter butzleri]